MFHCSCFGINDKPGRLSSTKTIMDSIEDLNRWILYRQYYLNTSPTLCKLALQPGSAQSHRIAPIPSLHRVGCNRHIMVSNNFFYFVLILVNGLELNLIYIYFLKNVYPSSSFIILNPAVNNTCSFELPLYLE